MTSSGKAILHVAVWEWQNSRVSTCQLLLKLFANFIWVRKLMFFIPIILLYP